MISEKQKIELGHLCFVDNFKEGLIMLSRLSDRIQLINKAARHMFKLPEVVAGSIEARMKADDFDLALFS